MIKINNFIETIFNILGKDNTFFVGGCVRDNIMGLEPHDIDIATSITPDKMIEKFTEAGIEVIPTGLKHGTITVHDKSDLKNYEITTFRKDVSCDGRNATIEFTVSMYEDSCRRDFTINAMYMDIMGNIFDFHNGLNDIKNHRLVFVGDAKTRITEDYLRILRFFRFMIKLKWIKFSEHTPTYDDLYSTIIRKLIPEMIERVSVERIQDELNKIFDNLFVLDNSEIPNACSWLNRRLFQDMKFNQVGINQISDKILWMKTLEYNHPLRNMIIFDMIKTKAWKFKFSNQEIKFMKTTDIENVNDLKKAKSYAVRFGKDIVINSIFKYGSISSGIHNYCIGAIQEWMIPECPIRGEDLINIGYKEGKDLGKILNLLKKYWIESNYVLTNPELLAMIDS